jgi:hypothetical protein
LVDGKATAQRLSGKPRIRPVGGKHAYVIVSSILLLPIPRRELLKTPEHLPELRASEYIVAGIDIDVVSKDSANVTFAPTSVWAKSRGGVLKIDFAERMAVITTVWNAAATTQLILADIKPRDATIDDSAPKRRHLAAYVDGYSLECAPNVAAHDRAGLARLLRYGARPPFAHQRLERLPNGNISYRLPKPFYTGQTHVVLPPLDFLGRLAALIPPRRMHTIRYHGLFAPNATFRKAACALVPLDGDAKPANEQHKHTHAESAADAEPCRKRTRQAWAVLLRRVFATDVLACPCGGRRRIIAALTRAQSPDALANYLRHIGEATEPLPTAPARAPPQTELLWPAAAADSVWDQCQPSVDIDHLFDN